LSVQFELAQRPDGVWARISANATAPAAAQEAAAANTRAGGWAFKIPAEKARALLVNRARVTTPPAAMARQGVMAMPSAPGTP
jgi:hypothetical protein